MGIRLCRAAVIGICVAIAGGLYPGGTLLGSQEQPAGTAAGPSADKKKGTIADVAWLAGKWVGEIGGGTTEDHWSEPAAGMMIGMFRMIGADGQTKVIELQTFRETEEGVELRFRHFNTLLEPWEDTTEPLVLRLEDKSAGKLVFVDVAPGDFTKNQPHRVVIEQRGADQYTSEVYVLREGQESKFFSTKRYRAGTQPQAEQAKGPIRAKAGCAACIYEMKGVDDCVLAVKIDGKPYLVSGSKIDNHGDAHAPDGLCNVERDATVSGEVQGDRFVASSFKLIASE